MQPEALNGRFAPRVTRAPTWPPRTLPGTCAQAAPAQRLGRGRKTRGRGRGRGGHLATAQGAGVAPPLPPPAAAVGYWRSSRSSSRSRCPDASWGRYLRRTGRPARGGSPQKQPPVAALLAGCRGGSGRGTAPWAVSLRGCGPRRPPLAPGRKGAAAAAHRQESAAAGEGPPVEGLPGAGTASLGTPGRAGRTVTRINGMLTAPCGHCGLVFLGGNWICLCPFRHYLSVPCKCGEAELAAFALCL